MTIFRWRKELETGLPLIDGQHKRLIEAANTFLVQYQGGAATSDVSSCLAFLEEYVTYHFACEEKIQRQCDYPNLKEHQEQHQLLATQVHQHKVRLEGSGFASAEVTAFYDTLIFWLKDHVMGDDVKFVQFYQGAAAKSSK